MLINSGNTYPEMHQSKKGNDWHFGMKAHIRVDAASGLVHTVICTAGNHFRINGTPILAEQKSFCSMAPSHCAVALKTRIYQRVPRVAQIKMSIL